MEREGLWDLRRLSVLNVYFLPCLPKEEMREKIWVLRWLTGTFYSQGWAFCSQLNSRTLSPFLLYEILEKLVTFIITRHHTLFEIHKSFTVIIWFENIFLNLFKVTLFFWPSTILIKPACLACMPCPCPVLFCVRTVSAPFNQQYFFCN